MILTATNEQGKTIFRDASCEVFYEFSDGIPSYEGTPPQKAEKIVAEYILCKLVKSNPTESGCGWASSLVDKLERRLADLRIALMDIMIGEARLQICYREGAENGE